MQEYCNVYKCTFLKRTLPEECLHPTSPRRKMCKSSVGNVIYHKFSHGAASYTLNAKNVNVMLESYLKGSDEEVMQIRWLILIFIIYRSVKTLLSPTFTYIRYKALSSYKKLPPFISNISLILATGRFHYIYKYFSYQ